jgi:hypothetical protein
MLYEFCDPSTLTIFFSPALTRRQLQPGGLRYHQAQFQRLQNWQGFKTKSFKDATASKDEKASKIDKASKTIKL